MRLGGEANPLRLGVVDRLAEEADQGGEQSIIGHVAVGWSPAFPDHHIGDAQLQGMIDIGFQTSERAVVVELRAKGLEIISADRVITPEFQAQFGGEFAELFQQRGPATASQMRRPHFDRVAAGGRQALTCFLERVSLKVIEFPQRRMAQSP